MDQVVNEKEVMKQKLKMSIQAKKLKRSNVVVREKEVTKYYKKFGFTDEQIAKVKEEAVKSSK